MSRLGFLASALAQGVTGYRQGQRQAEETAYTRASRAADFKERQDRSRALAEYNDSVAQSRRIEAEAALRRATHDNANDELDAERKRVEIDRLRHPGKYRAPHEPTEREHQMQQYQEFRDGLVKQGMPVEEANKRANAQFPLVHQTTLDDILGGMLLHQQPGAAPRDSTTTPP